MIKFTCRHYKASVPCVFNKVDGSECPSCSHVSEFNERVLFIKLDAIGDVLRSASLLPAIISQHNSPYIAWLTRKESAELVAMMSYVDETIELSEVGLARTMTGDWDCVYNLSNDWASASLASCARPKRGPIGYYLEYGVIKPSNPAAERWLEMAAFDRLKRQNRETYQQRMMSILNIENAPILSPAIEIPHEFAVGARERIATLFGRSPRRLVAINVGAGGRWPKKMLNVEQIHAYIQLLLERIDVDVVLLGGAAEVEKANAILAMCGTHSRIRAALTQSSVAEFVAILNEADALLCGDTLALHIATAIGLPAVAVFGPTSSSEIADFDGLIKKTWTRELECLACYGDCAKKHNCMSLLGLGHLVDLTESQLARSRERTPASIDEQA